MKIRNALRVTILVLLVVGSPAARARTNLGIAFRCNSLLANMGLISRTHFRTNSLEPLRPADSPLVEEHPSRFGLTYVHYESHRVRPDGQEEWLNKIIRDVQASGGEVRKWSTKGWFKPTDVSGLSYFAFDPETGTPRLSFDDNAPRDFIEHEYQHYLDWKEKKLEFMAQGISEREAGLRASHYTHSSPQKIYSTEKNAVQRQLQVLGAQHRPAQEFYPEIKAAYEWVLREQKSGQPMRNKDSVQVNAFLTQAIWGIAKSRRVELDGARREGKTPAQIAFLRDPLTIGRELEIEFGAPEAILLPRYQRIMASELAALMEYLE
ncbi:MAG TPA: hypothetical protein VM901_09005 [Bdellovibrionota bacterium]|nr:hypothetical protein [Bdellovibrionota bacterium]